jgi:ribosomal protein S18 acetylase RimI-like enzyme
LELNLRSLAYLTDLAILNFEGRVEDRGDYFLAETPDNPGYYWGNLLIMKRPPGAGDLSRWTDLFKTSFAHQPLVKHITFGWDSPEGDAGDIEPFKAAGFEAEETVVLTARTSDIQRPPRMNSEIQVRPLVSDSDWAAATENQVLCRKKVLKLDSYLPFKQKQMTKYRRMAEAGLGNWFGAFLGEKLIAECGLFTFNGVGRYQAVGTHPDFRRRGICGALIYHSAREAFKNGAQTLVMAAEPEYHAARIYKLVGFKETERSIGAFKSPEEKRG